LPAPSSRRPTVPEAFRKSLALFQSERIPFVVIGGLAASLHGEPRNTDDVDFMITLATRKVPQLAQKAKELGFDIEPDLAETQWLASGVVRLWLGPPGDQTAVDLVSCNSDFLREAAGRAQPARCLGQEVPIASPEDLLLFECCAWRPKDIPDAVAIAERHEHRLDAAYLRRWAEWLALKNPKVLGEVPRRLEAVMEGLPLPPPVRHGGAG
jgi:hypothetical protein